MSTSNRGSSRGFTLVELILVMVIAGILATVAVPRLVGRNSFDTRGYADQLAATVRYAQKLAIAQRRDVYVQVATNSATLCYEATSPCPAVSHTPGPGGEKPYVIDAPNGVTLSPTVTFGFAASGGPDIAAQLDLQVDGAATHHVYVEQETGYVHE